MVLRKWTSSKPLSGKDRKSIREKLFFFLIFHNSILQLFDLILREEENIIYHMNQTKKMEISIQFIFTYLPHVDDRSTENCESPFPFPSGNWIRCLLLLLQSPYLNPYNVEDASQGPIHKN